MPEVAFCTVPINDFNLRFVSTGVIRHRSQYSSKETTHIRGTGYWEATIQWARRNISDRRADITAIETFINSLAGAANVTRIPLYGDQSERFDITTVDITNLTLGTVGMEFDTAPELLSGDYFNVENRLHTITRLNATDSIGGVRVGGRYTAIPSADVRFNTVVIKTPKLLARSAEDAIDMPRRGSWAGPWTLTMIEAA